MAGIVLLFCLVSMASARQAVLYTATDPIHESYIIKVKANSEFDVVLSDVARVGGFVDNLYRNVFTGFSARLTDAVLQKVLGLPGVDYVEQDAVIHATSVGSWGLDRIDQRYLPLDGTYSPEGSGDGVVVYVIDTGIRASHEEFKGRATLAWTYPGGSQEDCNGHGTHCAGIVGSRTYGVAKAVQLAGVKVLNCFGSGSISNLVAGIDWVRGDSAGKAAVASMSVGGGASTSLDTAIRELVAAGVPTTVAAGNSNSDACNYSPGREPTAVTVGATTPTDSVRSSTNWGPCLDLYAPGTDITSTWYTSDTATAVLSGSSMACPHVAGALALNGRDVAEVLASATTDVLSGVPSDTPNKLLYVD